MIKRSKFYAPPPDTGKDIKQLFAYAIERGLGQPVDASGVPVGHWTPETLAEAISVIDRDRSSVDIRTVQYWFQVNNRRNISVENCRWLAIIFGCGDSDAISEWQAALLAARRLCQQERGHRSDKTELRGLAPDSASASAGHQKQVSWHRYTIAVRTEALFNNEDPHVLPLAVFIGACALALIAFGLDVHSVVYEPEGGIPRQVGFLWAPNWTLVFLAILPVYLGLLVELLRCWKEEWRPMLLPPTLPAQGLTSWTDRLMKLTPSLWMILVVTVVIASGFNWAASYLIPLIEGDAGSWPVDWARIAAVDPDILSVHAALTFSALVFLYNGFTAYLFFAGLALLLLIKDDLVGTLRARELDRRSTDQIQIVALGIMYGLYRCAALGITITLMMKLQGGFLQSGSSNILAWLRYDAYRVLSLTFDKEPNQVAQVSSPGSIYSLLCLVAILGTFVVAQTQIRLELNRLCVFPAQTLLDPLRRMNAGMACLVLSYFAIGQIPGFSVLVASSLLVAVFFMTNPNPHETKLFHKGT